MKRKVRVTITKEIEIELTPAVFGDLSQEQYLEEFRKGLWQIEGIEDVFKYAAEMAAHHGGGYQHDGLGLLSEHCSTHPRVPDVKFNVLEEDTESEFIE
ncbi:hypothetical protein DZC30_00835 [Comamonas testosteroni]|uniref:Uncharacterized protein n=1 Tax=Comamonas testosteroni TaxID=285 RepID=A0A373FS42_COMTE|nr:hypothetical protein DZC30_00835 [Comamonas testosteroni]